MALACFACVLAGNTAALWPLEHARFPLSWVLGGVAILSFLAVEICPPPSGVSVETAEEYFRAPEFEAVEL
jgi:hypothetical protein